MERLSAQLSPDIDFYRIPIQAQNPDHWAQVREHFKVGPRLPLLALFAVGRWQRSMQGPAPEQLVRAFLTESLSFDAAGNVL